MKVNIPKVTATLATLTAFFGSCCALPLLLLGMTGTVGFAAVLAPYQKYFTAITVILLAVAFYLVYGRKTTACENPNFCSPKSQRVTKILLWISTGLALFFLIGPHIIAP